MPGDFFIINSMVNRHFTLSLQEITDPYEKTLPSDLHIASAHVCGAE